MHGELNLDIAQLVGGGGDEWSQVRLEDGLMVAINLKNIEDKSKKGVELLEQTVEMYQLNNEEMTVFLKKIRSNLEEELKDGGSAVVAVVQKKGDKRVIYITGVGEATGVWLTRKEKVMRLWPSEGELISGWLEEGDLIVAGTKDFWEEIWSKLFGGAEDKLGEARAQTAINNQGKMAAVVAEVRENTPSPRLERGASSTLEEANKEKFIRNTVSLRPENNKRKKILLIAGAVFLVLFMANVALGMIARGKLNQQRQYDQVAQPIKDALTEAEGIKNTNIIRARDLVANARDQVRASNEFATGNLAADWEKLKKEVEEEWQLVSGEKQAAADLWLDLTIVKNGMVGNRLVIDDGWVEVLDMGNKTLAAVSLEDKTSKVVMSGDDLSGAKDLGMGVVATDKGVWQVDVDKKEKKLIIEAGEELEGVVEIRKFAGNIYSWDGTEVWKFPATDSGIGARRRYLAVGVQPDLSGVVDMWIDGEVWLVGSSGKVMRFSRGNRVDFAIKGWSEEWKQVVKILTDTESSEVLIWDKGNGVIGVFDKETGDYKRKLINDNLKTAEDLAVDEVNKRLILSVEGKLMEMKVN